MQVALLAVSGLHRATTAYPVTPTLDPEASTLSWWRVITWVGGPVGLFYGVCYLCISEELRTMFLLFK